MVRVQSCAYYKCRAPQKECTVAINSQRQVHLSLMGSSGHWQVPLIQVAPLLWPPEQYVPMQAGDIPEQSSTKWKVIQCHQINAIGNKINMIMTCTS